MIIGLTYDLQLEYLSAGFTREEVAEFDKEETIEGIEASLIRSGHTVIRIGNVKRLTERLARGEKWDLVFNICEGMYGIGRESQVPAILDAFGIPYTFSDPLVLALTLHKGMMKRIVRDLGVPTPDFTILSSLADLPGVRLPFPLFLKPVAEGSGKAISEKSVVRNPRELEIQARSLLESSGQPVLVERFLPGREFTTGILGTGEQAVAIGTIEIIYNEKVQTKIYSYDIKNNYEKFVTYEIPDPETSDRCASLALTVWKGIGGRDAGRVDIRMDENGIPHFIELNPLAGMNYIHSDLPIIAYRNGMTFDQLMSRIIDSATQRL